MSWIGGLVDKAKGFLGSKAEKPSLHTDAVRHTRFDKALFTELLEEAPALKSLVDDLHRKYAHTDDLVSDTLMQFFQAAPMIRPKAEMELGHLANHAVASALSKAADTPLTRTYTQHDKYGATMATIGVSKKVREYLQEHDELQKAAEEAEKAEQERQQAEDGLQEALGGAEAADAACQAEMGGYEGEGPLTEAQQAAKDNEIRCGELLTEALNALQEATDNAGECQQQALTEAERARQALRGPVEEAVKEAGEELAKEAALFRGWGVEDGEVEKMSFEQRAAMARRLSNHHLSEFVKELGRWKAMQRAQYAKRVTAARDEVFDVELGGHLPDIIAAEYAHLGSDLGRLDFLVRMSEGQLISKKYRGEERQGQGAIICLVDTSSSMKQQDRHGKTRELFSKGMALAMLDQARAEKRDFVGIIFANGTKQKVFRFPKGQGDIDTVLAFTETFLGGGTDFQRPLDMAMDILEEEFSSERKAKGDLVLLTDDECRVTPEWAAAFQQRKARLGARMFGLALGMRQPGSTLTQLSDNVRAVQEFVDPSQVADIIRTV